MIIIIGDSWGVGEWNQSHNLSGPGFGQYLMLHDQVVNLSVGVGSNTDSLNRLSGFLSRYEPNRSDTFYWITTCPSRCTNPNYYMNHQNGLLSAHRQLLDQTFDAANSIAKDHDITINLIGGLCDLDQITTNHSNLDIRVPSWGRLLNPNYYTWPGMPTKDFWEQIGQLARTKKQNINILQEWLDLSDHYLRKTRCWHSMKDRYFSTDGLHPDRHAHLALRNHLYPKWSFKI